jgi:squalene-associated FAD-dependent desaturase
MSPRVAVVGAGLAGLSAGLALTRYGFSVELLERSRLLGGKVTSFEVDGVEVDNGQHVFLGCCTEFMDFVTEAGLGDDLYVQPRFSVTVLDANGRQSRLSAARLPAPLHLMLGFSAYRYLSVAGKLRVARALLAARRGSTAHGDMATWLARHGQDSATRRAFWDPFLVPALNASLEEVGAKDGLFVIHTAFLAGRDAARVGYMRSPLGRLAEAAASRFDAVRRRSAVASIEVHNRRVTAVILDSGQRVECDACVLAVPPRRVAAILGEPDSLGVHGLDEFGTQPIVDVHLWYDRDVFDFDFAALLDSPLQWVFRKGRGYVCCSMSAAAQHVEQPERELVALCHRELTAALPRLRAARLLRGAATRDPEATFVPRPGLHRPGNATRLDNLTVAGAWTDTGWPATMESAVRSGRAAASTLVANHRRLPFGVDAAAHTASIEEVARAV